MMIDLCKIAAAQPYGTICKLNGKAWIPVKGFESHLEQELSLQLRGATGHIWRFPTEGAAGFKSNDASVQLSKVVYCEDIQQKLFWKQLCWEEPFIVQFRSINEAVAVLRGIQRNWTHYPLTCFRRAGLISEKLPYISKKEKPFPYTVPLAGMGVWSLLDEHTLLASAKTSSPFPLGVIRFREDHQNPPSRAYLKLWEALCLLDFYHRRAAEGRMLCVKAAFVGHASGIEELGQQDGVPAEQKLTASIPATWTLPQCGSHCVDAGACPGGWTWVLNNLGTEITAIDRSPLADSLMQEPRITFMQHDAFTLSPENLGRQDWVFSDVICYPSRLLNWIERWLASGLCSKFVCTIKIQGMPDFEIIRRFADIPHSKIVHLTANKHELTWLCAPFIERDGE